MIKSFSCQVVFYFAIPRAISAYVGENWLFQYKGAKIRNRYNQVPRLTQDTLINTDLDIHCPSVHSIVSEVYAEHI